ncbi:sensor histidine kinase [Companilactobacillus metriopterae]|uniref:sensor histidine kinase n=1 Tax=Companilactobacillus metriopterae TaxID=1909267 RepID=UPI00100C2A7E|nr:HAMP domain-containing sensor histidine kinase [Companilactobacillus metriopterae]
MSKNIKTTQAKMMQKQRYRLFITTMGAFAVLFISLGLLTFRLFENNLYTQIDRDISHQVDHIKNGPGKNSDNHDKDKVMGPQSRELKGNDANKADQDIPNAPFQSSIIVFSDKGKIENQDNLGNRYQSLKSVKLNKDDLNKTLTKKYSNFYFRTKLIKVSKGNTNPAYSGKYVLVIQNIDGQIQSIDSFRNILIIMFAVFWFISLILAFFLTRYSMSPIIKSWRQQSIFVNDAAHELRTPLTIIQGRLEYMLTNPNSTIIDEAESISTSLDEVNRLNSLTTNLLSLARSDNATDVYNFEDTEPEFFLRDPILPFKEICSSQSKVFKADIDHDVTLHVDRNKIKQLLIIMLDNATKYTSKNGTINIYDRVVNNKYQFIISDTGQGISEEDKKNVFDRFYRSDKSRNKHTGGAGLGLSIAMQIVRAHKGKIFIEDNLPQGTKFIIELPIKKD